MWSAFAIVLLEVDHPSKPLFDPYKQETDAWAGSRPIAGYQFLLVSPQFSRPAHPARYISDRTQGSFCMITMTRPVNRSDSNKRSMDADNTSAALTFRLNSPNSLSLFVEVIWLTHHGPLP